MKAFRRGLYDYEYFHMLEELGGDADALATKVMRGALNVGDYNPYWKHPLWASHGDWSHDSSDWDAARDQAARGIIALMTE